MFLRANPIFVAQLNQALRVIEAILRHMIVLYEDDVEKLKTAQAEAAAPEVSDDGTAEDTTESAEDSADSVEGTVEPDEDAAESE